MITRLRALAVAAALVISSGSFGQVTDSSESKCAAYRRLDLDRRFGLMFGLSESEVKRLMEKRGFTFGRAQAGRKPLRVIPDSEKIVDAIIAAEEAHGTLELWGATSVILGLRGGELALVYEVPNTSRRGGTKTGIRVMTQEEARQVVSELSDYFSFRYGGVPVQSPLPSKFRSIFLGPVQVFSSAHWDDGTTAADIFTIEAIAEPEYRTVVVIQYLLSAFPDIKRPAA